MWSWLVSTLVQMFLEAPYLAGEVTLMLEASMFEHMDSTEQMMVATTFFLTPLVVPTKLLKLISVKFILLGAATQRVALFWP